MLNFYKTYANLITRIISRIYIFKSLSNFMRLIRLRKIAILGVQPSSQKFEPSHPLPSIIHGIPELKLAYWPDVSWLRLKRVVKSNQILKAFFPVRLTSQLLVF